jgi:hypothetical protein
MERVATGTRRVFREAENTATYIMIYLSHIITVNINYIRRYKFCIAIDRYVDPPVMGKVTDTSGKKTHICKKYIVNLFC